MKYIGFGKWLFSSVVCLANKDDCLRKDNAKKMKDRGQESYEQQLP